MPKVEVEISQELNDRLMEYVARNRGVLYCQKSEVIIDAIKEYLDRNERKVRLSHL
jgi:metal-responsive CopG/Arc/MetJ family transcriptional regulator